MSSELKQRLKHRLSFADHLFMAGLELKLRKSISFSEGQYVTLWYDAIEGDDDTAYVTLDGEHFEIVIDYRLDFGTKIDYLIHEMAHVDCWRETLNQDDHCARWGESYAKMYRLYLEFCEEYYKEND